MSQRTFVLPVKELGARYVMEGSLRRPEQSSARPTVV
jgi:TolB-like protein